MRYVGKKGKVWEVIKKSVRTREKDCYTCGAKNLVGKNAQCGHFIPVALAGSNNTLSWDWRQIHLQCGHCNGAGQGMAVEYKEHLVKDFGEEIVQEFEKRRYKVDPVKNWEEIVAMFQLLEELYLRKLR